MTLIWPCPDCDGDLEDEGFGFWCPHCQHSIGYDLMATSDDERDRMTDERQAADDRH